MAQFACEVLGVTSAATIDDGSPYADQLANVFARSFEELCDGKWDHLPDQAFMYVGAIEEAAAKAETMKA